MKRNLRALQRQTSGGGRSSKSKRRRIQRAMKRQRCGETRQASIKRTSVLEQIFGNSESKRRRQRAREDRRALRWERDKQRNRRNRIQERSTEEILRNYNTVRTVCVRTCDGYYFPVSFSTKKSSLNRDFEACSNLCPGTEMKLYFHKTSGQSTEHMISIEDGGLYTSLPSAFAYRKSYNPGCSCNYRLLERKNENQPSRADKKQERQEELRTIARIATPVWRIDRGQDPETLANARGGFTPDVIRKLNPEPDNDNRLAETRKVRIIGDSFFPNQ